MSLFSTSTHLQKRGKPRILWEGNSTLVVELQSQTWLKHFTLPTLKAKHLILIFDKNWHREKTNTNHNNNKKYKIIMKTWQILQAPWYVAPNLNETEWPL